MIGTITIRERGPTPRNFKKAFNAASRESWLATGKTFHERFRDQRFSEEHAQEAGYFKRKGEGMARDSKQFKRSYTGRKLAKFGHTRPLEFSGETRRLVRTASITSTSGGGRVAYPGARKFNFRHPKSRINMALEFRRVVPREASELAGVFDRDLDRGLAAAKHTSTTKAA
jgi:hypothetical protein